MVVETSHGESSLNQGEKCVVGGVDPLIDFEGLHDDEAILIINTTHFKPNK